LIFNLEPAFAWLTSYIFLHERLGLRAGAGALMILAGILISELLGAVNEPDSNSKTGLAADPELSTRSHG